MATILVTPQSFYTNKVFVSHADSLSVYYGSWKFQTDITNQYIDEKFSFY